MARPATAAVRLLTGEREPVRLATSAAIDVDAGGLLVIDGVQTEVGDRVLLFGLTDGSENGIRTVSEGQWYRAADARTSRTLQWGTTVIVQEGTANAGKTFRFETIDPQIGDDALVIVDTYQDIVDDLNATPKTTPIDADRVFGGDSTASFGLVYATWAQIKTFLFASSALTGTPTAPTAAPGTNTTQIASTGFVKAAIDVVLGGVSASFDTLAEIVAGFIPNSLFTTRGDIIYRNATVPTRLPASTLGFLLQTNGAGTDPSWAGFLQAGTSAATRTWQDKARERVSVKDFGAVGDGVTTDTTAIQAAETYRASVGGDLIFPSGDYLTAGITVNRANGGGWRGIGNVRLLPTANSVILVDVTGAVISSTVSKVFYVEGIEFNFNGKTSVTGYRESASYLTRISRCKFNRLQYSALFTGPNAATQTGWITISDIDQIGEGSWLFRGYDDTRYIFNININNFNQQGTGAAPWTGVNALFHFQRAVSVYLNNVNAASLDGGAKGVYMQGDCQGVFLNNVIIGWPTYGVHAVAWTDTLIPSYVYINNCGMDQPTVKGFDIAGRTWRISNTNSTNGYLRGSTGAALDIAATATDITVRSFLAAYMNHDGIKVNVGAAKVIIANVTSENNNQNAGGNFDLNLTSCSFTDVVMEGRNYIGAAGVNATGQRVVNGTTSKEVSRNTGSASTTAVTTQEDLMSYTIPANALKVGQKVRLTAWGTTAANANGKTIRLWFGGNSIADHNGAWNTIPWRMVAELVITGASAQEYYSNVWPSANVHTTRQNTLTVTDTATIIVKATGQNAVATAADIVCQGFTVEIID